MYEAFVTLGCFLWTKVGKARRTDQLASPAARLIAFFRKLSSVPNQ